MIELTDNTLAVSFPEVHADARCAIELQRTLRIPDDNQNYPLPAGLGKFPLFSVDEFAVPAHWKEHGGVFLPMYQSEALWINFGRPAYPFAVKIAAGKINAVTGAAWSDSLHGDPQDYIVAPNQPWLDGFNVAKDVVRQFVATRLGQGFTAEEQLTGRAEWGGLQLVFYPMKAEAYQELLAARAREREEMSRRMLAERALRRSVTVMEDRMCADFDMGLAPGGRIQQTIEKDLFGIESWDTSKSSRCFVHLANSEAWRSITGREPPTRPFTAKQYAEKRIPWFDYYSDGPALPGSTVLSKLDGLASAMHKQGKELEGNKPIAIANVLTISPKGSEVREGKF